jgi:hypothetical protein
VDHGRRYNLLLLVNTSFIPVEYDLHARDALLYVLENDDLRLSFRNENVAGIRTSLARVDIIARTPYVRSYLVMDAVYAVLSRSFYINHIIVMYNYGPAEPMEPAVIYKPRGQ